MKKFSFLALLILVSLSLFGSHLGPGYIVELDKGKGILSALDDVKCDHGWISKILGINNISVDEIPRLPPGTKIYIPDAYIGNEPPQEVRAKSREILKILIPDPARFVTSTEAPLLLGKPKEESEAAPSSDAVLTTAVPDELELLRQRVSDLEGRVGKVESLLDSGSTGGDLEEVKSEPEKIRSNKRNWNWLSLLADFFWSKRPLVHRAILIFFVVSIVLFSIFLMMWKFLSRNKAISQADLRDRMNKIRCDIPHTFQDGLRWWRKITFRENLCSLCGGIVQGYDSQLVHSREHFRNWDVDRKAVRPLVITRPPAGPPNPPPDPNKTQP